MDAPALIERYGYLAILVGTCFEGEAVLLIGGYAARTGPLALQWVLVFGALGVFVSDWSCFLAGRFLSRALLRRFPRLEIGIKRPLELIERNQDLLILDRDQAPSDQIEVLAEALRGRDLEAVYLSPAARRLLQTAPE